MSLPLIGLGLSLGVVIPPWGSWPLTSQRPLALEGLDYLLLLLSAVCPHPSFLMVVLGRSG